MERHGFGKILLATDGSNQANAAIDITAQFARASSASVCVVHVWSLEVRHRHGIWDVEVRSEAEHLISETVKRLHDMDVDATGMIVRADHAHVASAIADSARQMHADLVVVGSRGLSDWQAMMQHSTSHGLLTAIEAPVLIVRGQSGSNAHQGVRVLMAVAGGDDVGPAVRAAVATASVPGSRILVVHVAQALVGVQGFAFVEPEEEIRRTLRRAGELLRDAGVPAEVRMLEPGPVAQLIADAAAFWKADLIVIGSSRIGDLGSMLLGSVTHGLIRATERPILVAERSR